MDNLEIYIQYSELLMDELRTYVASLERKIELQQELIDSLRKQQNSR